MTALVWSIASAGRGAGKHPATTVELYPAYNQPSKKHPNNHPSNLPTIQQAILPTIHPTIQTYNHPSSFAIIQLSITIWQQSNIPPSTIRHPTILPTFLHSSNHQNNQASILLSNQPSTKQLFGIQLSFLLSSTTQLSNHQSLSINHC